jgi:hypothetical protein
MPASFARRRTCAAGSTGNIKARTTWITVIGCSPAAIVVPRIHNKADAIEPARNFLSTTWIDEEHCIQGIRCLDSYAKAWDETHGTYKSEPVHNWASHGADALQTGARGFIPDYIPPPNDRYYRRPKAASAWAA